MGRHFSVRKLYLTIHNYLVAKKVNISVFLPPQNLSQIIPPIKQLWLAALDVSFCLKARTHLDEYRRALFTSVFQRVFCVHTQAILADDEPSEHANSFPDIRWRLM